MTSLQWNDEFTTGVDTIDSEHLELFDLVNEIIGSLLAGGSGQSVVDLLAVVRANVAAHFAHEEAFMDEVAFADRVAHKAAHDALLAEIEAIMKDTEAGAYDDRRAELAHRLSMWFSDHFNKMDAKLIEAAHPATFDNAAG